MMHGMVDLMLPLNKTLSCQQHISNMKRLMVMMKTCSVIATTQSGKANLGLDCCHSLKWTVLDYKCDANAIYT